MEKTADQFIWCLHCEIASDSDDIIIDKIGIPQCPHCGAGPMDLWPWDMIAEKHPEYPKVPEAGKEYPLYGPNSLYKRKTR